MTLYALTLFLSAFLLFLVQPIVARYILPWFGGSPGVWTTCLLFFQVALLGGYAYTHFIVQKLTPRVQTVLTLALLILTWAALPVAPSRSLVPENGSNPTWHILKLLLVSVGACYFLLASSGPLLQSWFARSRPGSSPYRLYTVSNFGALIAVVAYPFWLEPGMGLNLQTKLWSLLYVLFGALCGVCAVGIWKAPHSQGVSTAFSDERDAADGPSRPSFGERALWLGMPALSSTLLLAVTNQLCLDVAVIPLLWLFPMGLYLLTFMISFHRDRWYSRTGFGIALAVALAQACFVLHRGIYIGVPAQIVSYGFTIFVCCMVCHGELARLKPATRHLTSFYLMIAAGGALGGVFVNLVAPYAFKGYWELHLGLAGTALLFMLVLFRDPHGAMRGGRPFGAWSLVYLAFLGLSIALISQARDTLKDAVTTRRNFFGVLKVAIDRGNDPSEQRTVLMHGRIEHGFQYTAEDRRYWPTSYFGPLSGVGIAIRHHPRRLDPGQRHLRIGVVGLGTGTLAAYGEEGDYFRFYEINPDVIRLSNEYFSYCRDTDAKVDVVPGDARISMEREWNLGEAGEFDVLAVDAFSSDAIPVHLLTRECYRIYRHHLKKDGILAMHVSSRYFNLGPVIRSLAETDASSAVEAVQVEDEGNSLQGTDASRWILLTSNRRFLENEDVRRAVTPWKPEDAPSLIFTDDYSNLFRLLRKKSFWE